MQLQKRFLNYVKNEMIFMRLPTPYFENIPQFGNLSIDGIFLFYECPIVFTCIDCDKNLFICVCCDMEEKQRWLIAPTSIDRIEAMLSQKLTMREMFKAVDGYGCMATWQSNQEKESYTIMPCSEFSDEDVAEEGIYFQTEPDEFASYLQKIKNREENDVQPFFEAIQLDAVTSVSKDAFSTSLKYVNAFAEHIAYLSASTLARNIGDVMAYVSESLSGMQIKQMINDCSQQLYVDGIESNNLVDRSTMADAA